MLTYLSGYGYREVPELGAKKKPKPPKKTAPKKTAPKKDSKKKNPEKGKHIVAKIAMAPAREAFKAAVTLNFLKLAKKLAAGYKKDPARIQKFWINLGGDWNHLKTAIQKGSHSQLGAEPITMTAALATAVPLIIAVVKLFKDMKVTTPEDEKEQEIAIKAGKDLLEADASVPKGTADMQDADVAVAKGGDTAGSGSGGIMETVKEYWYIPTGLLGLYLFTKK